MAHDPTEALAEPAPSPAEEPPPVSGRPGPKPMPSVGRMLGVSSVLILIGTVLSAVWVYWLFPLVFGQRGPVAPEVKLIAWAFTLGPLILTGVMVAVYLLPKRLLLGTFACLVVTGIGVEIGLRLCIEFKRAGLLVDSPTRAWATMPDGHWEGDIPGYGYVNFHTRKDGFRMYGDPETTKTKVLVIGDSYTHGHRVSDGETYYERIAQARPDVEVFAYGCMGYSNWQEYLVLDEYVDRIRPDLILWQFCQNDFVHNVYEIESASLAQNNHIWRPYLENGKSVWRYPKETQKAWARFVPYSSFFRFLDARRDVHRAINWWTVEADIRPTTHPLYLKGAETVSEIMGKVKERAGKAQVVAFCVDSVEISPWIGTAFPDACDAHGIAYIHGIPEMIEGEKKKGRRMDSPERGDFHWNAAGHSLVARKMLDYLEGNRFLPPLAE